MAETLFDTSLGYSVSDDTTGATRYEFHVLTGIPGDPGLSANELALSNAAPNGSEAVNIASGMKYKKKAAGSGSDKWERQPTLGDITTATSSGSWRDPALLMDETVYANLTAAEAAVNTGVLQSVTLAADNRILFTAITGSPKDVYIINGTPGSGATLVQDTSGLDNNDVLKVDDGTFKGQERHYSLTEDRWVRGLEESLNEAGYTNTYIGKAGLGSELPDYSSVNYINDSDNLTIAVGKIDAQVGLNASAAQSANSAATTNASEINAMETAFGSMIAGDGTYVAHAGTNYIDGNADVSEDLTDLDAQIKVNTDALTTVAQDVTNLLTEVGALEVSLGGLVDTDGVYQPFAGTHYLDANANVAEDLSDLDTQIKANADAIAQGAAQEVVVGGVTALQEIDSVLVDEARSVEWLFDARQGNKVRSYVIFASHDGTTTADALKEKWDKFSKQSINGSISGFDVDVVLEGAGTAQKLVLKAEANSAIEVAARRFEVSW